MHTVWKNKKFSLTKEKFRQINSLVIYLVKRLFSRNFCQKYLRENFCNFHTLWCITMWTLLRFSFAHFCKIFVKVTFLLKKLLKSCFDEIFFGETKYYFIFPHSIVCIQHHTFSKIFRRINSGNHIDKNVTFTKFLPKHIWK